MSLLGRFVDKRTLILNMKLRNLARSLVSIELYTLFHKLLLFSSVV